MTGLALYESCTDKADKDVGSCVSVAMIPLIVPLAVVLCKVICLKQQRMIVWCGFLVCVIAQIIVISVDSQSFTAPSPGVKVWLLFIPAMVFGLLCDIKCTVQSWLYKPIAFKQPIPYTREALVAIGLVSFLCSVMLILFSFLAFTPLVTPLQFLEWFFVFLITKGICWSPFIANELYDTLFENIYHDV